MLVPGVTPGAEEDGTQACRLNDSEKTTRMSFRVHGAFLKIAANGQGIGRAAAHRTLAAGAVRMSLLDEAAEGPTLIVHVSP